jgi:hypothetical protein
MLLVRAVEAEDVGEALLTREDRHQATGMARQEASTPSGAKQSAGRSDDAFLAARARFAHARLETRFPQVAKVSRNAKWPAWLNWSLPILAFLIGMATNEIDSSRRLNIIAFPLLGMIGWNLAVYLLLLGSGVGALKHGGSAARPPNMVDRLIQQVSGRFGRHFDAQPALSRALTRFAADWTRASSKLTSLRTSRTLHISAAAFAAGVIAGMYLRALGIEYRAGWESTFMHASTVHALLHFLLTPASALTGIALPDPERLQALRWSNGRGEIAAPWIHLFAMTALLLIIVPRLILAAATAVAALRLQRRFPLPGREDFYVRRLLRGLSGKGSVVRIIPYSFHPAPSLEQELRSVLTEVLGDGTQVIFDRPVAYGEEEDWLAQPTFSQEEDHLLVLFNLASTPEAENHGAFVGGIRKRVTESRSGASVAILLDESGYRSRLAGQAGADGRLESRRQAWRRMLGEQGVEPLPFDFSEQDAATLSQRFEAVLMQAALVLEARHGR